MPPRSARPKVSRQATPRTALTLLSDLAASLAAGGPLADICARALRVLRQGTAADGGSVWLVTDTRLASVATDGEGASSAAAVASAIEASKTGSLHTTRDGLAVASLRSGERTLGAIAIWKKGLLGTESRLLLTTVADLLVPAVLGAEEARRHEAESASSTRELETQHRFIEKIVDSLPVGLHVVDREYRVQAWNRTREAGMQGVLRADALGRTIFDVLQRQPADTLRREFDEVFQSGALQQFETETSATGEKRTFRVSKIPMRLDDGAVTHVITIGEDITEWKRAQERIAQSQKLAALGQLATGVMHEINNPLATIAACAESIGLQLVDADLGAALRDAIQEYCRIIDHEVHRGKRIVDGLLDFSRPKAASRVDVDVADAVEQTLTLLRHHSRFKRMSVETSLVRSASTVVRANADQLIQVFMALLLNAMDAMNGEGTIHVRSVPAASGSEAVVEVTDHGHGIPGSEIAKIFEPFYTTKSPGRGTGLGLSICYGIVAEHGGRIEVESVVGKGSTFRVIFPTVADL
jgi:two-component system, NtrC family, sensor kinase